MMFDIADASGHRFLTIKPHLRKVTVATDAFTIKEDALWVLHYNKPILPSLAAAVRFWRRWSD